jgi:hypothetical protein
MEPPRSSAAPTPWTQRAASNTPYVPASPAASDEAANRTSPPTVSQTGRTRRPAYAVATAATVTTRAYVVRTHETPTTDVSNSK